MYHPTFIIPGFRRVISTSPHYPIGPSRHPKNYKYYIQVLAAHKKKFLHTDNTLYTILSFS